MQQPTAKTCRAQQRVAESSRQQQATTENSGDWGCDGLVMGSNGFVSVAVVMGSNGKIRVGLVARAASSRGAP
eukprot:9472031-Pyramimonas_sp.AAC.1